jgi:hypothetical protein
LMTASAHEFALLQSSSAVRYRTSREHTPNKLVPCEEAANLSLTLCQTLHVS